MASAPAPRDIVSQRLAIVATGVLVVAFALLVDPRVHLGARDLGALLIGTPDEHELALGIHGMLDSRTMNYRIPAYGGAYPNLAALALKIASRFEGRSERTVLLGLRHFSLVFGLLSLGALFFFTRYLSGSSAAGFVATAIAAVSPVFSYWSVRIHPDTLLLFILTLMQAATAIALKRKSQSALTVAWVLMGVAFMTKIVGIFMLPWIVLSQLFLLWNARQLRLRKILGISGVGVALFVLVMYVTTPTLLVDSRMFFSGLADTTQVATSGEVSDREQSPWLSMLFSTRLFGAASAVVFLAYSASWIPFLVRLARPGSWRTAAQRAGQETGVEEDYGPELARLVPVVFALGYLGYVILFLRNYQVRYLMPALPSVAAIVGSAIIGGWSHIRCVHGWLERCPRLVRMMPAAIFTLIFALEMPPRIEEVRGDTAWLASQMKDPRLQIAEWLDTHVESHARIHFDYGTYLPLRFKNATKMSGIFRSTVEKARPQYLVVFDKRREFFRDPKNAPSDDRGRRYFMEAAASADALERGELYGFRPIARFDRAEATIYFDETAPTCEALCCVK